MLISELIEKLQEIQNVEGDLEVEILHIASGDVFDAEYVMVELHDGSKTVEIF